MCGRSSGVPNLRIAAVLLLGTLGAAAAFASILMAIYLANGGRL